MTISSQMSDAEDESWLWRQLGSLRKLVDAHHCGSECSVQPECVEHCRPLGDDEDEESMEDACAYVSAESVLSARRQPVESPCCSGQSGQFTLLWADLQGMPETPVSLSDGKMHHSVLPLTGKQATGGLPALRFLSTLPMKAYLYKADRSDTIDVELQNALRSLPAEDLNVLALQRMEPGKYEIDGRQVHIYRGGDDGVQCLVHEDEVNSGIKDMPLQAYIKLVANVAVSLQRRGVSPSFKDTGEAIATKQLLAGGDEDSRYRAMRLACTQAELRKSSKYGRSSA